MPVRITVATEHIGRVAVGDSVVKDALKSGQSLIIKHNGNTMTIPAGEIMDKKVAQAGPFKDQFSNNYYYLYYFVWKPNQMAIQRNMFNG